MAVTTQRRWLAADGALLVALYAVAWTVLRTPLYAQGPDLLGPAIAFDLVVTATLLHGLMAKRAGLPRWTAAVPATVGTAVVSLWLPELASGGLLLALLAGAELLVGGVALQRLLTLARSGRAAHQDGASRLDALEAGLADALESRALAAAVVSELRLLAFGVAGPFLRAPADGLTHHRRAGWIAVAGALVFLSVPEMVAVHVVLERFAPSWVAWLVTLATAYGALWLWGDAMAMRLVPTRVHDDVLHLRIGSRWRADIPLADIVGVEVGSEPAELDLSVMGVPDLTLELARPVTVWGPLGVEKRAGRLSLQVDDVEAFQTLVP